MRPFGGRRDMSTLVLEIRAGEMMIVNGAPIRFRSRSRIEFTSHVRFLFGKQIMTPDQADSPARRIYFALQSAHIGNEDERAQGLLAARSLIEDFKGATTSAIARDMLDQALAAATADDCYKALKLTGRIIQHEDATLGRFSDATTAKTAWNGPIPSVRSKDQHENHEPRRTRV
jgi:flagellar protein FlbT